MPLYVVILYLLSSITLLLLGGMALRKDKKSPVNTTLFAFSVSAVLWMLFLYLGFYWARPETIPLSNTFFRLCFGFGFLMAFFLPVFFYYFTENRVKISKTFMWAFFSLGIFVFSISVFTPHVYESVTVSADGALGDVLGRWYMPFSYSFIIIFLISLFISIRKLFALNSGIEKKKLSIATWGSGLFMLCISLTNIILPMFGIIIYQLESGAFSLFFTIPAFYAVVRFRFLDITITFQNLLTEFSNVLLYVLPLVLFGEFFTQFPFLLLGVPLVVFLFRKHTYKVFNCFWNYFFFGRSTNYLEELKASAQLFKKSVKAGLDGIRQTLHTDGVRLAFSEDPGMENLLSYFKDSSKEDLVLDEIDYIDPSDIKVSGAKLKKIKKDMGAAMIAAAIPVWGDSKKLIGFLLLEKKVNGRLFSQQEIETTKKIINDVAFYIAHEKDYKNTLKKDVEKNTLFDSVETFNGLMHEIRHPLMVAQSVKDLVDWKNVLPEDQKFIQDSEEALSEMTHKLDAISEAFQWQSGLIELEKSYLDLESFFDLVQRDFELLNLSIDISKSLRKKLFLVDVHKLKEVFLEILKNATFFNDNDPQVFITAYKKGKYLCFDVQDNGKGVQEKNWEKIFDLLFVESFSRNRNECGLGVGLTKARGIVKKHGGTITVVSSSPEQGTFLRIMLPHSPKN